MTTLVRDENPKGTAMHSGKNVGSNILPLGKMCRVACAGKVLS